MKKPILIVGNFFSEALIYRSVGEDLASHLCANGWTVLTTSTKKGRLPRLFDMVRTVWRERQNYEVAHVDVFSGPAFVWAEAATLMLRLLKKPFVLTLRGGNLPNFARLRQRRIGRLFRSAAAVTTPSRYLLEQMRSYRPDLLLLPNPLDVKQYPFKLQTKAQPQLIWLRAFHDIYNPTLAPRVIAELAKHYSGTYLTMVGPDKGDGSLQRTKQVAAEVGVTERILFAGGVAKRDVPNWLHKGAIFLNTTNVDNAPVSVLEAMACGLCVVSTNVGGIPYLLEDGQDALLVSPNDPAAMVAAVRRILAEPELAMRLSSNARRKVEQFDWSVILPQWEQIFDELGVNDLRSQLQGSVPTNSSRKQVFASPSIEMASAPCAASETIQTSNIEKTPEFEFEVGLKGAYNQKHHQAKKSLLLVGNYLSESKTYRQVGQDLAGHLSVGGWKTLMTQGHGARLSRLRDMFRKIWCHRRDYDVAHVDVFSFHAFIWAELACWALRTLNKPYVLTLHGGNLPEFSLHWPGRVRRLLGSAATVTSPSRYLLEKMKPYREDMKLVPNPLDLSRYPFSLRSQPRPRLVWIRAFSKIYNPSLAPRILAELVKDFPDIQLVMVGPDKQDGSMKRTQQIAAELRVTDHITFPGGVANNEVPYWLNQGDVFINTTNVDNTPISVLEAMACGLCVVSTNVGGIPYLLEDGHSALLVPPDNQVAMATAVRRILSEPGLPARLSANARRKVEQFDWSVVLPKWDTIFSELIISQSAPPVQAAACSLGQS